MEITFKGEMSAVLREIEAFLEAAKPDTYGVWRIAAMSGEGEAFVPELRERHGGDVNQIYSMEVDSERREVRFMLPPGENELMLSEPCVYDVLESLAAQTKEWQDLP